MAQMATGFQNASSLRTRALVVPREHGAWGLLLVPLVTGACVGFLRGHGLSNLILFLTAALALFWLRTPLEILIGSSTMQTHTAAEKRLVWQAVVGLSVCAGLPVWALLRNGQHAGLLFIAAIAGTAFAIQACVKLFGRRMRMSAQIIGAIGLTSTAAGAYYVVTGRLDATAFALWGANWFFAGDQIHYVHVRLRAAKLVGPAERFQRGWTFLIGQMVMLGAVAAMSGASVLPVAAVLAFVPVTLRGVVWVLGRRPGLDVQWLGITELLQSITFGVLLITTFYVPR